MRVAEAGGHAQHLRADLKSFGEKGDGEPYRDSQTRFGNQPPVWFVTGTDDAGVAAAVQAFNAATLDQHFAVAVLGGEAIPLPDSQR